MRALSIRYLIPSAMLALSFAHAADAGLLMMPDSTNNRLVTFDSVTGALVNSNMIALPGGTPIEALQVNNEIWVSEQIGDRVSRFDMTGVFLGALGPTTPAAMDNVRGMVLIGNTVYVCSTGTGNGAGGKKIQMFDTTGANQGSFPTAFSFGFDILPYQGSILVSSDSANDDIHRYSLTGADEGTFYNGTLSFMEQMDYATNGDILVGSFTSSVIARFDPNTAALLGTIPASGARGVKQLGNGNILWSNSSGVRVRDVVAGTDTLVYSGGGRFIDELVIPEPATLALCAFGGLLIARRNRR